MGILKSRTRSGTLQGDLLHDYHALPKGEKIDYDDYTLINVSPSIVPTYYPGVRIFTCVPCPDTLKTSPAKQISCSLSLMQVQRHGRNL